MPTLNDVLAGSQAQAVQVQQIIDALKGTPNKGVPVALVSLNDTSNYALTVQNDDPINSRALSVLKADGTTLISADATGVTLGAPINVPAGSLNGTQLANASVTNAKLASDTARANLLTNGGFEIWQRGNGPFTTNLMSADRWQLSIQGTDTLSVSRNTANVDTGSTYCAALTFTLGNGAGLTSILQQYNNTDFTQLGGRVLSFSARIRCSTANAVRVGLYSGSAWTYSSFHTGGGAYETLTVSGVTAGVGLIVFVGVFCAATTTIYADNAMLVVGSQAADYAPLHPADDLARCLRYLERLDVASSSVFFALQAVSTTSTAGAWPYKVTKAVTPTITFSSTANFALTNAAGALTVVTSISAGDVNANRAQLSAGVASGLVAGNASFLLSNGGLNGMVAEGNP